MIDEAPVLRYDVLFGSKVGEEEWGVDLGLLLESKLNSFEYFVVKNFFEELEVEVFRLRTKKE